jgi:hypothetical protein
MSVQRNVVGPALYALLVLFWFMTKVADDLGSLRHHWLRARVILTKAWPATPWDAGILYSAV